MPCAETRSGPTSNRNPPVTSTTISVSPAAVAIHARTRPDHAALILSQAGQARSPEPSTSRRAGDRARPNYTRGS